MICVEKSTAEMVNLCLGFSRRMIGVQSYSDNEILTIFDFCSLCTSVL